MNLGMKNNLADTFIRLGQQLAEERDAAYELWTWLPSHKVAVKNHGDYADNFCPSVGDVLKEAAMYIAVLNAPPVTDYTAQDNEWFSRCTCGDDHLE